MLKPSCSVSHHSQLPANLQRDPDAWMACIQVHLPQARPAPVKLKPTRRAMISLASDAGTDSFQLSASSPTYIVPLSSSPESAISTPRATFCPLAFSRLSVHFSLPSQTLPPWTTSTKIQKMTKTISRAQSPAKTSPPLPPLASPPSSRRRRSYRVPVCRIYPSINPGKIIFNILIISR